MWQVFGGLVLFSIGVIVFKVVVLGVIVATLAAIFG